MDVNTTEHDPGAGVADRSQAPAGDGCTPSGEVVETSQDADDVRTQSNLHQYYLLAAMEDIEEDEIIPLPTPVPTRAEAPGTLFLSRKDGIGVEQTSPEEQTQTEAQSLAGDQDFNLIPAPPPQPLISIIDDSSDTSTSQEAPATGAGQVDGLDWLLDAPVPSLLDADDLPGLVMDDTPILAATDVVTTEPDGQPSTPAVSQNEDQQITMATNPSQKTEQPVVMVVDAASIEPSSNEKTLPENLSASKNSTTVVTAASSEKTDREQPQENGGSDTSLTASLSLSSDVVVEDHEDLQQVTAALINQKTESVESSTAEITLLDSQQSETTPCNEELKSPPPTLTDVNGGSTEQIPTDTVSQNDETPDCSMDDEEEDDEVSGSTSESASLTDDVEAVDDDDDVGLDDDDDDRVFDNTNGDFAPSSVEDTSYHSVRTPLRTSTSQNLGEDYNHQHDDYETRGTIDEYAHREQSNLPNEGGFFLRPSLSELKRSRSLSSLLNSSKTGVMQTHDISVDDYSGSQLSDGTSDLWMEDTRRKVEPPVERTPRTPDFTEMKRRGFALSPRYAQTTSTPGSPVTSEPTSSVSAPLKDSSLEALRRRIMSGGSLSNMGSTPSLFQGEGMSLARGDEDLNSALGDSHPGSSRGIVDSQSGSSAFTPARMALLTGRTHSRLTRSPSSIMETLKYRDDCAKATKDIQAATQQLQKLASANLPLNMLMYNARKVEDLRKTVQELEERGKKIKDSQEESQDIESADKTQRMLDAVTSKMQPLQTLQDDSFQGHLAKTAEDVEEVITWVTEASQCLDSKQHTLGDTTPETLLMQEEHAEVERACIDVYNDFANLKKMVKQFSESIPNGCGNLTGREKHMSQVCRTYISSMEHRRRVLTMAVKYHSSADQLEDMLQQFDNRATDVDNTDTCVNLNEIEQMHETLTEDYQVLKTKMNSSTCEISRKLSLTTKFMSMKGIIPVEERRNSAEHINNRLNEDSIYNKNQHSLPSETTRKTDNVSSNNAFIYGEDHTNSPDVITSGFENAPWKSRQQPRPQRVQMSEIIANSRSMQQVLKPQPKQSERRIRKYQDTVPVNRTFGTDTVVTDVHSNRATHPYWKTNDQRNGQFTDNDHAGPSPSRGYRPQLSLPDRKVQDRISDQTDAREPGEPTTHRDTMTRQSPPASLPLDYSDSLDVSAPGASLLNTDSLDPMSGRLDYVDGGDSLYSRVSDNKKEDVNLQNNRHGEQFTNAQNGFKSVMLVNFNSPAGDSIQDHERPPSSGDHSTQYPLTETTGQNGDLFKSADTVDNSSLNIVRGEVKSALVDSGSVSEKQPVKTNVDVSKSVIVSENVTLNNHKTEKNHPHHMELGVSGSNHHEDTHKSHVDITPAKTEIKVVPAHAASPNTGTNGTDVNGKKATKIGPIKVINIEHKKLAPGGKKSASKPSQLSTGSKTQLSSQISVRPKEKANRSSSNASPVKAGSEAPSGEKSSRQSHSKAERPTSTEPKPNQTNSERLANIRGQILQFRCTKFKCVVFRASEAKKNDDECPLCRLTTEGCRMKSDGK